MKTVLFVFCGMLVALVIAIQVGIFGGSRPADIGISNGRLKPPAPTRNSVSSQAALYPLQALAAVLASMPGVRVVERRPDYLHAEAETRWMKFVDDLEFWANPALGVIDLRSASRLGREDFGVNRERIEAIRAAYLARP